MKSQHVIAAVLAVGLLAACELQERTAEEAPEALDVTRAVPPEDRGELLGPVFAPPEESPLVVGDDFWAGEETVGYELVGTFISREALQVSLNPGQPVTTHEDRRWALSDILVAVDYRAPDGTAVWRVAGPRTVIDPYVEQLEEGLRRGGPITELGVLPLEVEPSS